MRGTYKLSTRKAWVLRIREQENILKWTLKIVFLMRVYSRMTLYDEYCFEYLNMTSYIFLLYKANEDKNAEGTKWIKSLLKVAKR